MDVFGEGVFGFIPPFYASQDKVQVDGRKIRKITANK
jgi:hypothetical protein